MFRDQPAHDPLVLALEFGNVQRTRLPVTLLQVAHHVGDAHSAVSVKGLLQGDDKTFIGKARNVRLCPQQFAVDEHSIAIEYHQIHGMTGRFACEWFSCVIPVSRMRQRSYSAR